MHDAIDTPPAAFAMPAALVAKGYALRPEVDDDTPFLIALYGSTRAAELDRAIGWSEAQRRVFIESQFAAQRHHYRTYYPGTAWHVIEQDGAPIGRLYLEERPTRLHIIDIALMPQVRGRGIGTALIEALIAAARPLGKSVGIFVETFNPALSLYRRLGFVPVSDAGVYVEMEWSAAAQAKVAQ